jgi:hypothetical protein
MRTFLRGKDYTNSFKINHHPSPDSSRVGSNWQISFEPGWHLHIIIAKLMVHENS